MVRKLIKSILIILNFVVAGLYVLSTLARFIAPSKSIIVSMLGYAYLPLLVLNVVCMLFWLIAWRRWWLLSTVAIVLRWSFIPLYVQAVNSADVPAESHVTIMTFNAHHFYGRDFVADVNNIGELDNNAKLFLDIIDEHRPTVICLQEFSPTAHRTAVSDSLLRRGYHTNTTLSAQNSSTNVYSLLPMRNATVIEPRSIVSVDLDVEGTIVRLFNLHLQSYQLGADEYQEFDHIARGEISSNSGRTIARKLAHTAKEHEKQWLTLKPHLDTATVATVIVGDFNEPPASYFYQQLLRNHEDSFKHKGTGLGTTYHGKFPAFRIDYVMHDKRLRTSNHTIVHTDISDHYPLIVTLSHT